MKPVVENLTLDEMLELAAYAASLPVEADAKSDAEIVDRLLTRRIPPSLRLDADFLDNRFPLPRLLLQRCGELLWRSDPCFHADAIQAGADLG